MAIKTAPIETSAPTPKQPRKTTQKPVEAAPAIISIPSSPEPVVEAVELQDATVLE